MVTGVEVLPKLDDVVAATITVSIMVGGIGVAILALCLAAAAVCRCRLDNFTCHVEDDDDIL
jgi:hypothetical protein